MTNWKEHKEFQQALQAYLSLHGIMLDDTVKYESGIDCVGVFMGGQLVLSVALPPVSNYQVRETEYARQYRKTKNPVAV